MPRLNLEQFWAETADKWLGKLLCRGLSEELARVRREFPIESQMPDRDFDWRYLQTVRDRLWYEDNPNSDPYISFIRKICDDRMLLGGNNDGIVLHHMNSPWPRALHQMVRGSDRPIPALQPERFFKDQYILAATVVWEELAKSRREARSQAIRETKAQIGTQFDAHWPPRSRKAGMRLRGRHANLDRALSRTFFALFTWKGTWEKTACAYDKAYVSSTVRYQGGTDRSKFRQDVEDTTTILRLLMPVP